MRSFMIFNKSMATIRKRPCGAGNYASIFDWAKRDICGAVSSRKTGEQTAKIE
jgi:hypothetical protein